VRQIEDLGLSAGDYDWYLDMHREAGTQQAGFGMGFERLVRYACGLESIRQAL
jgi:asparaginyl-tRNA synthetase